MIEEAIRALPELKINQLLNNQEYVKRFHCLNNRQIREAPDFYGLMDMRSFFRGRPLGQCAKRLTLDVPPESGSLTAKQDFFVQLGTQLPYTARNNLFHAVKGPDDPGDKTVAENAYHLLEPWIAPLLEAAKKQSNEVLRS